MTEAKDDTPKPAPVEALAVRVSQWVMSLVLAWGIALGAPALLAASIFEEHPHSQVSQLDAFPSQALAQAEGKRRQPQVFPTAHWRRFGPVAATTTVFATTPVRTRPYHVPCFGRPPPIPA